MTRDSTSPSLLHSFFFPLFLSLPPLISSPFALSGFCFQSILLHGTFSFPTHVFCPYTHFQMLVPCICLCGAACPICSFCLSCRLCPCLLIRITETSNPSTFFLKLSLISPFCLSVHFLFNSYSIPPASLFLWSPPLGLPLSLLPQ